VSGHTAAAKKPVLVDLMKLVDDVKINLKVGSKLASCLGVGSKSASCQRVLVNGVQ